MAQTTNVDNATSVIVLEEVVIGSQLQLAVQFEKLISANPDVFEPMDFSDMVLRADIKLRPSIDVEPAATFDCAARDDGSGWIDLTLDGVASGQLQPRKYQSSLKVWPTDHPEQGDTLVVFILPMTFLATR